MAASNPPARQRCTPPAQGKNSSQTAAVKPARAPGSGGAAGLAALPHARRSRLYLHTRQYILHPHRPKLATAPTVKRTRPARNNRARWLPPRLRPRRVRGVRWDEMYAWLGPLWRAARGPGRPGSPAAPAAARAGAPAGPGVAPRPPRHRSSPPLLPRRRAVPAATPKKSPAAKKPAAAKKVRACASARAGVAHGCSSPARWQRRRLGRAPRGPLRARALPHGRAAVAPNGRLQAVRCCPPAPKAHALLPYRSPLSSTPPPLPQAAAPKVKKTPTKKPAAKKPAAAKPAKVGGPRRLGGGARPRLRRACKGHPHSHEHPCSHAHMHARARIVHSSHRRRPRPRRPRRRPRRLLRPR
jgi:hypothetical protein